MTEPATFELPSGLAPFDEEPSTRTLVTGEPDGHPTIGLVLKRTYRIGPRGGWEPVAEDDQEVVLDDEIEYEEAEPPFCSPIAHGNDVLFRPATDVVVQGTAYASAMNVSRTTVRFRMQSLRRDITVYGNRRVERGPAGELRFAEPEVFESMPIRYDRAYGGVDLRAFLERRSPLLDDLRTALPGVPFDQASPAHYPRNPSGLGFVLRADAYDPDDLFVPNLEYEFDPVTPERLAVGVPGNWPTAPLPAGMDWSGGGWFPRQAFLGVHGLPAGFAGRLLERELGWVPDDLLTIPSVVAAGGGRIRPAYAQGASPGMTCALTPETIRRGIPVKVVGMHPELPELRMELPRDWPQARLALHRPAMTDLEPALSAIVIRPAEPEVVMVWCARTGRDREYTPEQYANMTIGVDWRRDQG